MFLESKPRAFRAEISDEIRARAGEDPTTADTDQAPGRRDSARTAAALVAGAAVVVGAVVIGAIVGLVIAGAVLVLFIRAASDEGAR